MKKIITIFSIILLSSCESDDGTWYEYIPVVDYDVEINQDWFLYQKQSIKRSVFEMNQSKEKIEDETQSWDLVIPWVMKLQNDFEACMMGVNKYNYESVNFDSAQFDVWGLSQYLKYETCY